VRSLILPISLLCLLLCIGGVARADDATRISVDLGWDGAYRVGRWTPLFITLSHDRSIAATIELTSPHSWRQGMRIVQPVTIGPTPNTFCLFFVPAYELEQLNIDVRDAERGRLLASRRPFDAFTGANLAPSLPRPAQSKLIGVSGRPGWNGPTSAFVRGRMDGGSLPIERLPDTPVGLDGLDLLILNAPDLTKLSKSQQHAIISWVRGGGSLLFWADENAVPDDAPLLDILPARIGSNVLLEIPPQVVNNAGLPDRFTRLRARVLQPKPGAEPIDALSTPQATGFVGRVGLGRVATLPFDASLLLFNDEPKAATFWSHVLIPLGFDPSADDRGPLRFSADDRVTRLRSAVEQIGSIEGAGSFDFGTIAWTLLGLMFIVGPLDWFVLKRLNRQPWTWATTAGWIGLVTVGSLYAGQLLRSGELHVRTVSIVEQIDGRCVSASDIVAVYSPTTRRHELSVPPGWWQPLPGEQWYASRGLREEYDFLQSRDGNAPLPLRVPIWSLRFLYGQRWIDEPALIEAKLSIQHDGETVSYSGTLRNLHRDPIKLLRLECFGRHAFLLQSIAPGETVTLRGGLRSPPGSNREEDAESPAPTLDLRDRLPGDGSHVLVRAHFRSDNAIADLVSPIPYPAIYEFTEPATVRHSGSLPSGFVQEVSDELIEKMLAKADATPSPFGMLQFRPLGGQFARVAPDATAFPHRDRRFLVAVLGLYEEELSDAKDVEAWMLSIWEDIRPEASGVYSNFLADEGPERVKEAYGEANYRRLVRVKQQYDPENVFHFNQNIPTRLDEEDAVAA